MFVPSQITLAYFSAGLVQICLAFAFVFAQEVAIAVAHVAPYNAAYAVPYAVAYEVLYAVANTVTYAIPYTVPYDFLEFSNGVFLHSLFRQLGLKAFSVLFFHTSLVDSDNFCYC